jgi:protein-S-isoprenylcysteine O-methyltransferase Ste14
LNPGRFSLLVLLAFAAWLSTPLSVFVALSYVAYIDRFQIRPEEDALRARFGAAYEEYVDGVRRWV